MAAASEEATVTVNGVARSLRCASLSELVRQVGHDPDRPGIAVAVNGEVIPRALWPLHSLEPGDEVEIVGAVQGG